MKRIPKRTRENAEKLVKAIFATWDPDDLREHLYDLGFNEYVRDYLDADLDEDFAADWLYYMSGA